MNLKIATLNIRSINKTSKIFFLNELLNNQKIDLLALQETHLIDLNLLNEIKNILPNYQILIPILDNSYKGIGFIISNKIKVISCEIINKERFAIISIHHNNTKIDIANIYAPNNYNEQIEFINDLYNILIFKKSILMGDFNHVKDNTIERSPPNSSETSNQKSWAHFFNILQLSEATFNDNINLNSRTWFSGDLSARLDRIYVDNRLNNIDLTYDKKIIFPESDHQIVIANLNINIISYSTSNRNTSLWKLNDSILDDSNVYNKVKEICKNTTNNPTNDHTWYDNFIKKITKCLKYESKCANEIKNLKINYLINEITKIELENDCNNKIKLNNLKKEINLYYLDKKKGIEIRNKFVMKNFCNIPNKILIKDSYKNYKKTKIESIFKDNSKIYEEREIESLFFDHYSDLIGKPKT
jgi:exonuclease III